MLKRPLCLFLICLLCLTGAAFAEDAADTTGEAEPEQSLIEQAIDSGVAEDDLPVDADATVVEADASDGKPSIAGLRPLYTTKIKLMTATGSAASIRVAQDTNSETLAIVSKGTVVTIYKVYPSFVLAEYNGTVGYILRTCIDENCTIIDPTTTPPYGVMPMAYVARTTAKVLIYASPSTASEAFPIAVGEGSRVAIIEFVNGFAKVYYWRSYGYIDAHFLTDLVIVSGTEEPLSDETPIAAFSSFFKYNNGNELNDGRVKNIVRSCELMTRVMQPGESLDFNAQIGPYKRANGYFPAPVLIDGGSQPGYGGGTCQSSSTLYNTIRQLPGVTILMRKPHGPGSARYLPQHTDAAVGNSDLNLIFRNDYDFPIRIVAESTGEGVITISIYKG